MVAWASRSPSKESRACAISKTKEMAETEATHVFQAMRNV